MFVPVRGKFCSVGDRVFDTLIQECAPDHAATELAVIEGFVDGQRKVTLVLDGPWIRLAHEAKTLDPDLVRGVRVPTISVTMILDGWFLSEPDAARPEDCHGQTVNDSD
jgi:hypothetical protein